jgi:hypothetical protein
MQEDQLHLQLTVIESMIFASKLKCFTFSLDASQLKIVKFELFKAFIIVLLVLGNVIYNLFLDRLYFGKSKLI